MSYGMRMFVGRLSTNYEGCPRELLLTNFSDLERACIYTPTGITRN